MFEDGHRKLGLAAPLSGIIGGCTTRCAGDPSDAAESTGERAGLMAGAPGGMPEAVYEGSPQTSTSPSAQSSAASYGQIALLGDDPHGTRSLFEPELFTWANESWTVTDPGAVDLADPDRDAETAEIMGCVTAMADGLEDSVRIPSQRIRFGMDSGRAQADDSVTTEMPAPGAAMSVEQSVAQDGAAPTDLPEQAAPTMIPTQQREQAEPFIPASQITDRAVWGGPIVFRTPDTAGPATQPQPFSALVEPKWTPRKAWKATVRQARSLRKPGDPSLLNRSVWLSFPPAPAWVATLRQHILQPVRRTGRRWEPSARSVPLLAALVVLAAVSSLAVVQATSRELRSSAVEMASIGQVGSDMVPGFAAPKVVTVPAPAKAVAPAPSAPAPDASPAGGPTGTTHRAAPAGATPARSSAVPPSGSPAQAATQKSKVSATSRAHDTASHSSNSAAHDVAAHETARQHRGNHHSSSRSDDRDDSGRDDDYYSDDSDGGQFSDDDGGLLGGLLGGLGGGALGGLG